MQQYVLFHVKDKVHNSYFTWLKMTFEFDSKSEKDIRRQHRVCRNQSKLAHIQRSPPPPLLSCLCRERLNSFDSTVKLLIWLLSVCWQPFNTVLQVQAFTYQAQVGQGIGVSVDDKCMELVKLLFGKLHHLFLVKTVFQGPFACPGVTQQPTTLCLMYM